ncbi:Ketopantoate reductase PanE/ApbA [Caprobacter fermentans]|uniref:Ketopantoate reductase PanE/ApbA n=1 Tax=Caproicibacter fermentans TaxID=2576756 RepID=A0A6N8HZX8_9FIRM|nr:2-dehydropantoate 2-reductase N-terminal domain-containing protein [Caproicibacter fermentans]MVB11444.1 Ketopantoate reductase PanE/ApbA [Caproicibacter fermentans]
MNVLIVGTGVIGALYGCALSQKHHVVHYVRQEKLTLLDQKEITFDFIDERQDKKHQNTNGSYTYHCVANASDNYDLIIVPVKTFQLAEALRTLTAQAPNANYLLMTLDWNMSGEFDKILGKSHYVLGYAGGGGTFRGNQLWANLGNDVMLGAVYQEQQPLLNSVNEMFKSCGIIPNIEANPLHWLWVHNVGSAPLGAALAKYHDMSRLLNDKRLIKISFKAMRECYKICEKRGVDLKKYDEVKMMSIPLFVLCPMFRLNFTKNPAMQRYTAHAVDSIDEMVQNFKEIFATGSSLDVDMPNMRFLMKLVSFVDGSVNTK